MNFLLWLLLISFLTASYSIGCVIMVITFSEKLSFLKRNIRENPDWSKERNINELLYWNRRRKQAALDIILAFPAFVISPIFLACELCRGLLYVARRIRTILCKLIRNVHRLWCGIVDIINIARWKEPQNLAIDTEKGPYR